MPAMKEKFAGVDRYRHFINGQWTDRRDHSHRAQGDGR
jgi:hypothetical protein